MIFESSQLVYNLNRNIFLNKSWFNIPFVELIIFSQFKTPTRPSSRDRVSKEKLLRLYMNTEKNVQADTNIKNANKGIKYLERYKNN